MEVIHFISKFISKGEFPAGLPGCFNSYRHTHKVAPGIRLDNRILDYS